MKFTFTQRWRLLLAQAFLSVLLSAVDLQKNQVPAIFSIWIAHFMHYVIIITIWIM